MNKRLGYCYVHGDPSLAGRTPDPGLVSTDEAVPICPQCRAVHLDGAEPWDYGPEWDDAPTLVLR